jgi:hypothetical protein
VQKICLAAGTPDRRDVGGRTAIGHGAAEITVCRDVSRVGHRHTDDVVFALAVRMCILHELGHLWLSQFADEQAIETFMFLTGAQSWRDPDVHLKYRGVEIAANTIAWGLLGAPIEILSRAMPPCGLLHDAFITLTDTPLTSTCRRSEPGAPPAGGDHGSAPWTVFRPLAQVNTRFTSQEPGSSRTSIAAMSPEIPHPQPNPQVKVDGRAATA